MILELPRKKPGDPDALPIGAVVNLTRELPGGTRAYLDRGWRVVGYTESGKGNWSGYELEAADGRKTVASKFEAFDHPNLETTCMSDSGENLFDGEAEDVDHGEPISEQDNEWAKWQEWITTRPEGVQRLCAEFPVYTRIAINGWLRWVIGYSEDDEVVMSTHCPRCYPLEITREEAVRVPVDELRGLAPRRLNG